MKKRIAALKITRIFVLTAPDAARMILPTGTVCPVRNDSPGGLYAAYTEEGVRRSP